MRLSRAERIAIELEILNHGFGRACLCRVWGDSTVAAVSTFDDHYGGQANSQADGC